GIERPADPDLRRRPLARSDAPAPRARRVLDRAQPPANAVRTADARSARPALPSAPLRGREPGTLSPPGSGVAMAARPLRGRPFPRPRRLARDAADPARLPRRPARPPARGRRRLDLRGLRRRCPAHAARPPRRRAQRRRDLPDPLHLSQERFLAFRFPLSALSSDRGGALADG